MNFNHQKSMQAARLGTVAILLSGLLSACKKESESGPGTPEEPIPQVIIYSPGIGAEITGQLRLQGKATDDKSLHEARIMITDTLTGTTVFRWQPHVHGDKEFAFDTLLICPQADTRGYIVEAAFEDHDDQMGAATVRFSWRK